MSRTNETSHNASNSWCNAKEMCDRGGIDEFILPYVSAEDVQVSGNYIRGLSFV